jgi:hypothetical protein
VLTGLKNVQEGTNIKEPLLKIAIVGDPKVGKSWLAATAPKPIFVMDFDGRASSLAGKANVFVKSYVDIGTTTPKAVAELESDIASIEYEKSKGNPIPATFVLDSMTYLRKFCEAELIKQQPTTGRTLRLGTSKVMIGAGWDIYNGGRGYLEYLINRLASLGNLICVFHSEYEKDDSKSTPEKKAYTGKITVKPNHLADLLSIFNDVWLLAVDYAGKRFVQTGINDTFVGACTFKGLNPLSEAPDIEAMLVKHRAELLKGK